MARIVVLGGTGFSGGNIVAEAQARGHEVTSVSRSAVENPVTGVRYVQGTVLDLDALAAEFDGADVVVSALAPKGDMADEVIPALQNLIARLQGKNVRLGVVGGYGASLVSEGGPMAVDVDFPEQFAHSGKVGVETLRILQETPEGFDWFLVHPPVTYGAWAPVGERTGVYRDGGAVVVRAEDGSSSISGADFAVAFVDEIERQAHPRARFSVGY